MKNLICVLLSLAVAIALVSCRVDKTGSFVGVPKKGVKAEYEPAENDRPAEESRTQPATVGESVRHP